MSDIQPINTDNEHSEPVLALHFGGYDFIHMNEHGEVENGSLIVKATFGRQDRMELAVRVSGEAHHINRVTTPITSIEKSSDGILTVKTDSNSLYVLIPQPEDRGKKHPELTRKTEGFAARIRKMFNLS